MPTIYGIELSEDEEQLAYELGLEEYLEEQDEDEEADEEEE
jgi:hypothetical protein